MRVWKGPSEKDSSNDEWEYVCRPHHTQFPKGVVIDEDLQWEDMFHDAFVAPTMDVNRNGRPLLIIKLLPLVGSQMVLVTLATPFKLRRPWPMMSIKHVQCWMM